MCCENGEHWDLLAEANARPGVERKEDEGILEEVFLEPVVEEAIRVELLRCYLVDDLSLWLLAA